MGTIPSRKLVAGAFFLAIIASIDVAKASRPDETRNLF